MLSAAVATVLLVFLFTGKQGQKRTNAPGGFICVCVWIFFSCFFLSVVYFDLESKTTCTCHTTDQHYY